MRMRGGGGATKRDGADGSQAGARHAEAKRGAERCSDPPGQMRCSGVPFDPSCGRG